MTNFDYLKSEKEFSSFVDIAITAEKIFNIDVGACVLNCRRAVEMAVKWMYSVDKELEVPYQETLYSLMHTDEFKDIVDSDLWKRLDFIRKYGNNVAHTNKKITKDVAKVCLKNLFYFTDFIACCYGKNYEERSYDESLLQSNTNVIEVPKLGYEIDLKTLLEENEALKAKLSERRIVQQEDYIPKPLELSEYKTRKLYIDSMLIDAGWEEGKDWDNEVEVKGMPNKSKKGFIDYVLYDDRHVPLAIIEAKKTCTDPSNGKQQAKLYADILEKQYNRRPIIFLTNGFETKIIDGQYHERKIAAIYSKRDLEKLFNLKRMKSHLDYVYIKKNIADRYYQEAAVKAVCEAFDKRNRRKALLVMATGSGKTRTVIALVDVLLQNGWIKNILFLADRNSLVTQAKRSFTNLLPELSNTNLVEEKDNYNAHAVFSTYQTMMGCIDSVKNEGKKLFTCGHFDLIICDEAHRSIYNKYKDIFNYFDGLLVGLTATPKAEVGTNTYEIFGLEDGVPTYGYELDQAVKDDFLVDFLSVETSLKFIEEGISWEELSETEKEEYENTFISENGIIPSKIDSSALNTWVFNEDTIKKVLQILFKNGLKIEYGQKLGKTIIFAKNHDHAKKIYEVFNKEFPHLPGYAMIIDNHINYVQSAIDEFSDSNKLPQIAISVDMLDTGIDVPEILNLVFFKKVLSKAKFWQMIGRGTRKCAGLIDGEDKNKFYIFDFCGNFEFFRMDKGKPTANALALQAAIFKLKFQIAYKLQDIAYQIEELIEWRKTLVDDMVKKVRELNRESFTVRQHLKYVDLYSNPDNYQLIPYEDIEFISEELLPLILPDEDEINALRFDALVYGIELAYLDGKKYTKARTDLIKKIQGVASVANIPEIRVQAKFINQILNTSYLDDAGIKEFEEIRKNIRDLIKYIPGKFRKKYNTNFEDDILSMEWHEPDLGSDELKNYKIRLEFYIRQHEQDNPVILKLKTNVPLTKIDVQNLEHVVWDELGTKEDYYNEYGEKPLGEFVREIVGLDLNAAKKAFAKYLDERNLNSNQIYFVNQVVEFIVRNGVMKDFSVLQESPFVDKGSIVDLFGDDLQIWNGIRNVISNINQNALYA